MFDILYNAEITIAILPQDLLFQLMGKKKKSFSKHCNSALCIHFSFFSLYVCETDIKITTQRCILDS